MLEDLAIIEGKYLRDILHQPQALENTVDALEMSKALRDIAGRLNQGKFQKVVLTGMGSSFHALHPLNLQLISHGITALMVETAELVHYSNRFFDPRTLIIAVSQSGQSAEMVRLVRAKGQRCKLIAVTNTPGSTLAKHANATVLTKAGSEFSVSCKTYVTALMALKWIGSVLCERSLRQTRRELNEAHPAVAAYLVNWKDYVRSLAQVLKDTRYLYLVGRGASLASAATGALIVKESAHFPAEGMSSAAFRHGPFEMLGNQTFVLVFAGDARTRKLNERLRDDIQEQKGRAELVEKDASLPCCCIPEHGSSIQQILEILPAQMMTLALAARAGREAGRFEFVTKVTTIE